MAKTKTKKVSEPQQKQLSKDHLMNLEVQSRDILLAKSDMHLEEQALKNMILQVEVLTRDIEKQKVRLVQKAQTFENEKKKYNTLKKDIFESYGIPETSGLGYDTTTGIIIETPSTGGTSGGN